MATQHETGSNRTQPSKPALKTRSNLRPAIEIHWGDLDANKLRGAVDAVTRMGGAIILGVTSDGGALSICILDRDTKIREYPHTALEAEEVLDAIMQEYV